MRLVRIVKRPFLASCGMPVTLPLTSSRQICRSSERGWESGAGPEEVMYSLCSLLITFMNTV